MENENKNSAISIISITVLISTLIINAEWIYKSYLQYTKEGSQFFKNTLIFYGVYVGIQTLSAALLIKILWRSEKKLGRTEVAFLIAFNLATAGMFFTTYMAQNH